MDKGEQSVIELVNAWASYSAATPEADIAGFCLHYLTEHTVQKASGESKPTVDESGLINEQWVESLTGKVTRSVVPIQAEARLGSLVGRLGKYAAFYAKKAMQSFDFNSIEDPIYLIALLQMGVPKKSELIYEMMAEFASGIDVINRLVRMELIEEFPDEQDRRSKRLRITPNGMVAIGEALPVMGKIASVAYSSLTEGEQALLMQLLDKLDRYHIEHYRQSRNASFDEVYERMVADRD